MSDANLIARAAQAKAERRTRTLRALGVAPEEDQAPASDVRALAGQDFATLERVGLVIRDDLRPEVQRAWRNAIAGVAHGRGLRVDTGTLEGGAGVWAGVNRDDGPPDTAR